MHEIFMCYVNQKNKHDKKLLLNIKKEHIFDLIDEICKKLIECLNIYSSVNNTYQKILNTCKENENYIDLPLDSLTQNIIRFDICDCKQYDVISEICKTKDMDHINAKIKLANNIDSKNKRNVIKELLKFSRKMQKFINKCNETQIMYQQLLIDINTEIEKIFAPNGIGAKDSKIHFESNITELTVDYIFENIEYTINIPVKSTIKYLCDYISHTHSIPLKEVLILHNYHSYESNKLIEEIGYPRVRFSCHQITE